MSNPVLVEVVRSGFVESVHRGAVLALGPDGEVRFSAGDITSPVFPRSSNKPLQALGMLRAGLDLEDGADLAIACASHSGERTHVQRVLDLLARHDVPESALHCPPDLPLHEPSRVAMLRAGEGPRRAAMNCSGKHAAMLATCVQAGWPIGGYADPGHKLQLLLAETVAEYTGEPIAHTGVDGCGAPLFAFSLTGLARAFACLVTRRDGPEQRVADAMRAHPWLVAGTGREDTQLMGAVPGLLAKGGAEGVHAVALPDGGAIALKIDDGAPRARGPLLVAVLRALDALPDDPAALADLSAPVLGAGQPVGELRVPAGLLNGK
ncbi:asparaginase [Amycolatopsis nigrescens]|uniref:asparaginase n=1 Tax=Amycolatopsis nigrescens TaxID=381445 RepID=UPI000379FE77|nr:asparaginase [Amycolatopsis nigrescens]